MGDLTLLFIMAALALGTGWGAYKLVMIGQGLVIAVLLVVAGGLAVFLGIKANVAQGWDAIGYFAFLMVFVVPVLAGLGIGGLVGLLKRHQGA